MLSGRGGVSGKLLYPQKKLARLRLGVIDIPSGIYDHGAQLRIRPLDYGVDWTTNPWQGKICARPEFIRSCHRQSPKNEASILSPQSPTRIPVPGSVSDRARGTRKEAFVLLQKPWVTIDPMVNRAYFYFCGKSLVRLAASTGGGPFFRGRTALSIYPTQLRQMPTAHERPEIAAEDRDGRLLRVETNRASRRRAYQTSFIPDFISPPMRAGLSVPLRSTAQSLGPTRPGAADGRKRDGNIDAKFDKKYIDFFTWHRRPHRE